MAKGQAVVIPTTLKVKTSKNAFPTKQGRPPSETFLAFKGHVQACEDERLASVDEEGNVPKYSEAKGIAATDTDTQDAIIRYIRRAASELQIGVRTAISEDGTEVMFLTKPMRATSEATEED